MAQSLSILIATQGRRHDRFLTLLAELEKQIGTFPIEVVGFFNNGEKDIGYYRNKLLEAAKNEYVCFIDDDDQIPPYYCHEIMTHLGKDYVGFMVKLQEKKTVMKPVYHSIRYGIWHEDEYGFYRSVTHLNPIKRELALQGKFGRDGMGEDETWARSVQPLVRTENYIPKVMYEYLHDADDTSFGGVFEEQEYERPEPTYPWFRWVEDE